MYGRELHFAGSVLHEHSGIKATWAWIASLKAMMPHELFADCPVWPWQFWRIGREKEWRAQGSSYPFQFSLGFLQTQLERQRCALPLPSSFNVWIFSFPQRSPLKLLQPKTVPKRLGTSQKKPREPQVPRSLIKEIFRHFAKMPVTRDAFQIVEKWYVATNCSFHYFYYWGFFLSFLPWSKPVESAADKLTAISLQLERVLGALIKMGRNVESAVYCHVGIWSVLPFRSIWVFSQQIVAHRLSVSISWAGWLWTMAIILGTVRVCHVPLESRFLSFLHP